MFFVLSKTLAILLLPSNLLLVLAFIGAALLFTRWRRFGAALTAGALLLVLLCGCLPIGTFLLHTLEQRFPRWDDSRGAPDGVIVLGGAVFPSLSVEHGTPSVGSDAGRLFALAKLARDFPKARIIYSGGEGTLVPTGRSESSLLGPVLDRMGVPRERVELEHNSRNTAENARFGKEVAQPKPGERWLLVTSAAHMPRAVGAFRHAGFPVEAYPVAWRTGARFNPAPTADITAGLGRLNSAMHEWIGLIAYRTTGRSDALFPAP